jgi:glutaminyl-tRNA synthetase
MSKRFFGRMIDEGIVRGFDDPRLPTLSGVRRRGFPSEAIINACKMLGVAKANSTADLALLEHCVREDLNKNSPRVMGILRPLRLVIDNYPEDQSEEFEAVNNPEDPATGTRKVPFSRVLYIEQEDFREEPPPKYFRLAPGREIRLRYAYFITCVGVKKDPKTGEVIEVHCTYDPATRGGNTPDGRKVKSTIHWVSAAHALKAEVRLYENLFTKENPNDVEEGADFMSNINRNSLEVLTSCRIEPFLVGAAPGNRYQFERIGYFCVDPDTTPEKLVFNRTVSLRDDWAKIQKQQK